MAKPTSILDTLNALDAIADRGMASATPGMPRTQPEAIRAMPQRAQPSPSALAAHDSGDHLVSLFIELKRDIENLRREQASQAVPPGERQLYGMLEQLRREIAELKSHQDSPLGYETPRAALATRPEAHAPRRGASMPMPPLAARRSGAIRPDTLLWAVPLMLIAGVALYFLGRDLLQRPVRSTSPAEVALSAPSTIAAPATASPSPAEAHAASPLYDTFSMPSFSPRGVAAEGVTSSQALARANALLVAKGSARDTDEASFWLRHFVSMTLGDDQVVRALTMLGSTYAEPSAGKAPDYAAARQLWEIAGGLGDPVALCFLGRLHEAGLSVPADARTANQWQQRANRAGGCASIDAGK